jgi:hypothetical protein
MKPIRVRLALAAAAWSGALCMSAAVAAGPYDGVWAVTLTCAQAPDGAYGYTFRFNAEITDSVLHGEHGTRDAGGWLTLDGPIPADGHAMLDARGLTGSPAYTVGQVKRLTPYAYTLDAHFDAHSGSGERVQVRRCDAVFVKQ